MPSDPRPTDVDAWRALDERTREFSEMLREGRCRPSGRFRGGVANGLLAPLRGAWTLELLFLLYMHGPLRFGEAKKTLDLSSRVLTDKLRALEAEGLVERRDADDTPGYALTPRGETIARHLHPIVFFLGARLGAAEAARQR